MKYSLDLKSLSQLSIPLPHIKIFKRYTFSFIYYYFLKI